MIQVKMFDCDHEKDLEEELNAFLETIEHKKLIDIKYQVGIMTDERSDQVYCFTAMVLYKNA